MRPATYALVLATTLVGCKHAPPAAPSRSEADVEGLHVELAALQRSEYEILGPVVGTGQAQSRRGRLLEPTYAFGYVRPEHSLDSPDYSWTKLDAETLAERIAVYNAIQSMPGADSLILPRFERRVDVQDGVRTVVVRVFAKAVRVKLDPASPATGYLPAPPRHP